MNEEKKSKTTGQILGDILAFCGVIILVSEFVKQCNRPSQPHCGSGYTPEERSIIDDYLDKQDRFDHEYGTSKAERM